jgi:uncharacterized protein DUF3159
MSGSANDDAPPPLAEAVGGALGIAESVLPSAAFVAAYTATGQQTQPALIAAVALGALFAIARVVRRQPARFALAGLVGIAISAYVVPRTGRAWVTRTQAPCRRGGRGPARVTSACRAEPLAPIYRQVTAHAFVIFAVSPEAGIDQAGFDAAERRSASRSSRLTKADDVMCR